MASTSVKLSISWNDFQSSMSGSFGNLRKEEELFDVTLVSDDGVQISAHKVVLAACSTFFKNTLKSGIHPHPLIFLSGISSVNINSLLEYIYEGKVAIHQEQLESFLETATKLKITSLRLVVRKHIILNTKRQILRMIVPPILIMRWM